MATAATIAAAAAAASAAGSIGTAAYQASQGGPAGPKQRKIPLTPYMAAFERYNARLLAQNETNQPPSFGDWLKSGGTATFPINNPGFTPQEARRLGIVGPHGTQVPFVSPGQSMLTPEQQLYLGYQQHKGPLFKAYRENQRIGRLEGMPQTAGREAREARLRSRRDAILNRKSPGGGLY